MISHSRDANMAALTDRGVPFSTVSRANSCVMNSNLLDFRGRRDRANSYELRRPPPNGDGDVGLCLAHDASNDSVELPRHRLSGAALLILFFSFYLLGPKHEIVRTCAISHFFPFTHYGCPLKMLKLCN